MKTIHYLITIILSLGLTSLVEAHPLHNPNPFSFFLIEADATPFATFSSNNRIMSTNYRGAFLSYIVSRNSDYTAQGLRIVHIPPVGGLQVIYFETLATNPACVEALSSGEVVAAFPDFINNTVNFLVWSNLDTNTVPVRYSYPSPMSGKFSCAYSESRRTFYYLGNHGDLLSFNVDFKAVYSERRVLERGSIAKAEYTSLSVTEDGTLHAFVLTIPLVTGQSEIPQYRSVQYLASPNNGVDWFRSWKFPESNAGWIQVPVIIDENGPTLLLSRGEDITANPYLIASLVDDDYIYAMSLYNSGSDRCLIVINQCSITLVRHNRKDGLRSLQRVPLMASGETIRSHAGGVLSKIGDSVYFITNSGDKIFAYRSQDSGKTWELFSHAKIPLLPEVYCVIGLGGKRSIATDKDIIGVFSVVSASCQDWAQGVIQVAPTKVVAFQLALSL